VSRALATALLREQTADPWRCWIRHAPLRWPGPEAPWVDLASGTLGSSDGEPEVLAALHTPRLADVLYLPPVPAASAAARDRLAAHHAARGTPVLVQLLPEDPRPADAAAGAAGVVVVWDVLAPALALAAGGAPPATGAVRLPHARPGDVAIWPLVPGAVDDARLDAAASALSALGVEVLQPLPLELGGRDRRALGEAMGEAIGEAAGDAISEASYLRLFHGETPSPLPVARAASRRGLLPLLPRPLPRPPLVGAGNLRIAGVLTACGELCLLLGEPETRAQTLLRAGRFAEREGRDLAALAREGNLAVLPWLEGEALQVAAEVAGGAEARLWRQQLDRLASS
jgi:hypothetical protein